MICPHGKCDGRGNLSGGVRGVCIDCLNASMPPNPPRPYTTYWITMLYMAGKQYVLAQRCVVVSGIHPLTDDEVLARGRKLADHTVPEEFAYTGYVIGRTEST